MSASDGGSAFPTLDAYVDANGERPVYATDGGMSLRAYIASTALQGFLAATPPDSEWPLPDEAADR